METYSTGNVYHKDGAVILKNGTLVEIFKEIYENEWEPDEHSYFTQVTKYHIREILAQENHSDYEAHHTYYMLLDEDGYAISIHYSIRGAIDFYHREKLLWELGLEPVYLKREKTHWGNSAYYKWKEAYFKQIAVNDEKGINYLIRLKHYLNVLQVSDIEVCNWVEAQKAEKALKNLIRTGKRVGKVREPAPVFIEGFSGRSLRPHPPKSKP